MLKDSKIYISGHNGMVGSAITRELKNQGYNNLVFATSKVLDLRNQQEVNEFFQKEKPEFVVFAAAKVGGIIANNTYRADFLYDNLMMQSNVIHAAYQHKVEKLLFLGSSCIYPKFAEQPIKESALLTGELEYTNEPYAIAKIAGIKLCENYRLQYGCNFISAMPTNLYGPGDNYNLQNSHVIPGMMRKLHLAKLLMENNLEGIKNDILKFNKVEELDALNFLELNGIKAVNGKVTVKLWGTGSPLREFMHVDDLATSCVYLLQNYNELQFINVGSGEECSIKDLAYLIKKIVEFEGEIEFDSTKPDGTPRKLMDNTRLLNLGIKTKYNLNDGIYKVYNDTFLKDKAKS